MKAFAVVLLALAAAAPVHAQYSARRLTSRVAPQVQRTPPPQQPAPAQPAPQPAAPGVPQYAYPAYQYPAVVPQVATRPVDPVKAAAEKAKNDEKQFDYFKRRAEEGSDHAQYELGIRYLAGRGTAPDEKLGREWLAKAAKNGNSQAAKKLAELGVEPAEASAPEKPAIQKIEPAPASKQESKPAEPAKSSSAK